jgi:hypothetical protein
MMKTIFQKILATTALCLAVGAYSAYHATGDCTGTKVSLVQNAEHGYARDLEMFIRDYVNDVSLIRNERYAVGDYAKSHRETEAEKIFDDRVKNYIAGIKQLSSLETLCHDLWRSDVPEDMPTSLWTDAEESMKWYLCERIAQFGTQEAYEALSRLRNAYSDGAWCGFFRSLEWKYLRQYSKDPVVLKSKSGKFH